MFRSNFCISESALGKKYKHILLVNIILKNFIEENNIQISKYKNK